MQWLNISSVVAQPSCHDRTPNNENVPALWSTCSSGKSHQEYQSSFLENIKSPLPPVSHSLQYTLLPLYPTSQQKYPFQDQY